MMKNWIQKTGVVALCVGALACSKNETENQVTMEPDAGKGNVAILMVDAPAEYDHVYIDVQDVEVKQDSAESNWSSLEGFTPEVFDLLTLTNGEQANLGSISLSSGEFGDLRLILGDSNFVVIDSVWHELTIPSGSQSGLKIKVKDSVVANVNQNLVLDFDAGKSVVEAGNSGNYNLKPVIKATMQNTSASLEGMISPAGVAFIYAVIGEDTTTTYSDSIGGFTLWGLQAGDFSLVAEMELDSVTTLTGSTSGVVELGENTLPDTLVLN